AQSDECQGPKLQSIERAVERRPGVQGFGKKEQPKPRVEQRFLRPQTVASRIGQEGLKRFARAQHQDMLTRLDPSTYGAVAILRFKRKLIEQLELRGLRSEPRSKCLDTLASGVYGGPSEQPQQVTHI